MRRAVAAWALAILALAVGPGCSRETRLSLTATIRRQGMDRPEPLSSVRFEILPYDREAAKDSLRAVNRPGEMPPRDRLLEGRRQYEEVAAEYEGTLDSIEIAENALRAITDHRSAQYRSAYERIEAAKKLNASVFGKKNAVLEKYIRVKADYDEQVKTWEAKAYRGLADREQAARKERGHPEELTVKTDKAGRANIILPGGKWWISGRARTPDQRYAWYAWNVLIEAKGGTLAVALTPENATVVVE